MGARFADCRKGLVCSWHIAAPDVCDGTSAVGKSRHRIPGASVGQPTEPCLDGKVLYEWCLGKSRSIEDASCTLYIAGFVHGAMIERKNKGMLCLPERLTAEEARAIFVRTMRTTEDLLMNESIDTALAASLAISLCKKR